jgi:Icc-related predicted phosphoesterase
MISQEESSAIAKDLKKSKLLISHDSPYQIHSTEKNKEGLIGITEYIKEKKPELHLYGHHHIFKEYMIDDTLCICNYRLGIIDRDGKYFPFVV